MADIPPGLTSEVTSDEREEGYLPVQGELHFSEDCRYKMSTVPVVHNRRNNRGGTAYKYKLTRDCYCKEKNTIRDPERSEDHFNSQCRWKRIQDQAYREDGEQKVYLYRKCRCSGRAE